MSTKFSSITEKEEARIVDLLNTTELSFALIGTRMSVSATLIRDVNLKHNCRPQRGFAKAKPINDMSVKLLYSVRSVAEGTGLKEGTIRSKLCKAGITTGQTHRHRLFLTLDQYNAIRKEQGLQLIGV